MHRIGRTGRAGASGVAVTFVDWDELTRWSHINQALNLDFADPQETYSSSAHLFAQLEIPTGATGRLTPQKPLDKLVSRKPNQKTKRAKQGRSELASTSNTSNRGKKRERVRTKRVHE